MVLVTDVVWPLVDWLLLFKLILSAKVSHEDTVITNRGKSKILESRFIFYPLCVDFLNLIVKDGWPLVEHKKNSRLREFGSFLVFMLFADFVEFDFDVVDGDRLILEPDAFDRFHDHVEDRDRDEEDPPRMPAAGQEADQQIRDRDHDWISQFGDAPISERRHDRFQNGNSEENNPSGMPKIQKGPDEDIGDDAE